jgi:hypothetical protein
MIQNETKFASLEYSRKYAAKLEEVSKSVMAKFEKYQQEIAIDLTPIDKTELAVEVNRNISLLHRYITKYSEEKFQLSDYENKMESLEGELFDYYRFHWDKSTKLTESAISKYVYSHIAHINLQNLVKLQKIIIDYLENVIETLRNRNFAIKNIIDVKKMELNIN